MPSSRLPISRFTRMRARRQAALWGTTRAVGLTAFAATLAAFLACATAPERGFAPLVIESPPAFSEPSGFRKDSPTSRLYLRPERGNWPMVRNSGPGYSYAPEEGVVSWYGYDHLGRQTATGDWFDPQAMTAAHKSLPFGTLVRVTRLDTGESVEVTINDRGPFIDGRIIDLARKPAGRLDLIQKGIAPCRVEVLKYPLIEMAGPSGNG